MNIQKILSIEGPATAFTDVRFFSSVDEHVAFPVGTVSKAFLAHGASVRLLSCVSPHVCRQVAGLSETLVAELAFKRPFASMEAHVLEHLRVRQEALVAAVAVMRSLPGVNAVVAHQRSCFDKSLAAERARVPLSLLAVNMALHVCF